MVETCWWIYVGISLYSLAIVLRKFRLDFACGSRKESNFFPVSVCFHRTCVVILIPLVRPPFMQFPSLVKHCFHLSCSVASHNHHSARSYFCRAKRYATLNYERLLNHYWFATNASSESVATLPRRVSNHTAPMNVYLPCQF